MYLETTTRVPRLLSDIQSDKSKNAEYLCCKWFTSFLKYKKISVYHFDSDFLCRCGDPLSGAPTLTQARHRAHLQQCFSAMAQYQRYRDLDLALAAEGVRLALTSLGRITGRVGAEEILDIIFKDFCIGKWADECQRKHEVWACSERKAAFLPSPRVTVKKTR